MGGAGAYDVAAQMPIPPARSRDRPTEWTPGQSSPQSPPIVPSFPCTTLTYIKRLYRADKKATGNRTQRA